MRAGSLRRWRNLGRDLALAGLALWLVATPVRAADIFDVTAIPVDATADNAVAARKVAIDQGERDGLRRLLERLTAPSMQNRLPPVANVPIDDYVRSYQVASEKVGPTRYIASLNVTYQPAAVQSLLEGTGLPYVNRRSEPVLLVPAMRTDTGVDLWSPADPWREAWNSGSLPPTFLDLRLPLGDLADIQALPPQAAQSGDPAPFQALAARYGTTATIVAVATLQPSSDADHPAPIDVELRRVDDWSQPFGIMTLTPTADETGPALLQRAVNQAIIAAEDDWKAQNLVPSGALAALPAVVPLVDLASWVQIRSRLASTPGVHDVVINMLSRDRASITINYAGALADLEQAFGREGLVLTQENNEWLLRQAGDRAALPAPSPGLPATP